MRSNLKPGNACQWLSPLDVDPNGNGLHSSTATTKQHSGGVLRVEPRATSGQKSTRTLRWHADCTDNMESAVRRGSNQSIESSKVRIRCAQLHLAMTVSISEHHWRALSNSFSTVRMMEANEATEKRMRTPRSSYKARCVSIRKAGQVHGVYGGQAEPLVLMNSFDHDVGACR